MAEANSITSEIRYREIDGFPGYMVGNDGTVWSRLRWGGSGGIGSEWRPLTPCTIKGGYRMVSLSMGGEMYPRRVHTLVLEAFVGPCPEGMQCLHGDGNPANNCLWNLRWGTAKENAADRALHGNWHPAKGADHYSTKRKRIYKARLSDEEELEVLRLLSLGQRQTQVARQFGVSQPHISHIVTRRRKTEPCINQEMPLL